MYQMILIPQITFVFAPTDPYDLLMTKKGKHHFICVIHVFKSYLDLLILSCMQSSYRLLTLGC